MLSENKNINPFKRLLFFRLISRYIFLRKYFIKKKRKKYNVKRFKKQYRKNKGQINSLEAQNSIIIKPKNLESNVVDFKQKKSVSFNLKVSRELDLGAQQGRVYRERIKTKKSLHGRLAQK